MNETEKEIAAKLLEEISDAMKEDRFEIIDQYQAFMKGVQMRVTIEQQAKLTGAFLTEGA